MAQGRQPDGRILFADDDAFYREMARATLEDAGFKVLQAAGGGAAIAALGQSTLDLLVVDLEMPDMNGLQVIEQVRAGRTNQDLPILVITGHDDADSVGRAFDAGATSFLAKPLNWPLFVHHVRFVLKSARAQHELRNVSRMADFMSDLKSRLVGTLVSEFQAPLKSAFGFAKLLRQEADGPIASDLYRTWIAEMHASLDRLSGTHAKMLNFGRVLADGIALNEDIASVDAILSGLCLAAEETAVRRNIKVVCDLTAPQALQVNADAALLSEALRTILLNAVKFSPRGSRVTMTARLESDGRLAFVVEDASTVLGPQQIEEVLGRDAGTGSKAIETLDQTTGLKMSRVLIEAHQGTLEIRALAGEGLVVSARLPAQRVIGEGNPSRAQRLEAVSKTLSGTPAVRPAARPLVRPAGGLFRAGTNR